MLSFFASIGYSPAHRSTSCERNPNHNALLTKGGLTMPYQNIDATLSAADLQAVKDALATIVQKLPFLVTLTNEERKGLFKTGASQVDSTGTDSPDAVAPSLIDLPKAGSRKRSDAIYQWNGNTPTGQVANSRYISRITNFQAVVCTA